MTETRQARNQKHLTLEPNQSQVDLAAASGEHATLASLFAEELGLVLEVAPRNEADVLRAYESAGVSVRSVGWVTESPQIEISVAGEPGISGGLRWLRPSLIARRKMVMKLLYGKC